MTLRFITDGKLDRESLAQEIRAFLQKLLAAMHLEIAFDVATREPDPADVESPEVVVTFRGRDQELLLERSGELLKAIEYLTLRCLHLDPHFYDHARFDCADYISMRIEELKLSARVAADQVRASHLAFKFNPMPPRERRIIHLALKDTPGIRTSSEGMGDHRHIVIYPADKK
jgi:spoIIIJ-associated protein